MKWLRFSETLAIIVFLVASRSLLSQIISPTPSSPPLSGPTVLSPTAISDIEANRLLEGILSSSSAADMWRRIRRAKTDLVLTSSDRSTPLQLALLDDWSGDETKYRRGTNGVSKHPSVHNGQGALKVRTNGREHIIPEFDQARVLIDHIPIAAIEIVVRRKTYLVKSAPIHDCPTDQKCVDIYRQSNPNAPYLHEQRWELSSATGLPSKAFMLLTGAVSRQNDIWEEIDYLSYSSIGGLIMPTAVKVSIRGRAPQTSTLVSLVPGALFDTERFDEELKK